MRGVLRCVVYGLLVVLVFAGCAKQPTEEMSGAKVSVDAAKAAGSTTYLPEEVKKMDDSLTAAMDEVKVQDGKFVLSRNYDKAKGMLATVKSDAEKVKTDTAAKKEEKKKEAITLQGEAKAAIDEAKALLTKAPMGKGAKTDIEAMKGDVKGLEDSLPEVQALIDKEDYLTAIDKAKAVKEKAGGVSEQVKAAMEKVKPKKGGKK
ncbi:MAG: hypothetical protein HZC45_09670 [Deltaproteobacteria bacterium]|nr:hypothetical protein [Deltaproteobacteria bacterium]